MHTSSNIYIYELFTCAYLCDTGASAALDAGMCVPAEQNSFVACRLFVRICVTQELPQRWMQGRMCMDEGRETSAPSGLAQERRR